MKECFVIQPFDGGQFDKRYDDIIGPAIVDAGLIPYRVDRDPSVTIPIEEIEAGIRRAAAVVAEITVENPNVWFELGYAIATGHKPVLLCSDERTTARFPFDVQHRAILTYETESSSDFEVLRERIVERLGAIQHASEITATVASRVNETAGLEPYEITALVVVAENTPDPGGRLSGWRVRNEMESAGYTALATKLALAELVSIGLLDSEEEHDHDGSTFSTFGVTKPGIDWLMEQRDKLHMRLPQKNISMGDGGVREPAEYDYDSEPF